MEKPIISVIVPVYRVEKYLHRCVDSLLNQTITAHEIILVDDGSPDRCPELCDEYAQAYPQQVRVLHKPNGGVSSARNAGLPLAQGEFIWFVDSDDYVEPNAIETLLKNITPDTDVLVFGTKTEADG